MIDWAVYGGLLLNGFLAATLLPASSEVTLAALVQQAVGDPWLLLLFASVGNTGGSIVNWLMGRFLRHYQDRRWFPVSERQINRASSWFARFGLWSLLFAWLPIIGDPLTAVAGLLRVPFLPFLILVAIGKAARYVVIILLALQLV